MITGYIIMCSFEKAIEYPQMYQKTLNNLATTYFRLGKLDKAEFVFLESIQNNSDQPMTYNNLGNPSTYLTALSMLNF